VVHLKSVIFFYTELHFENMFSLNFARIAYDLTSSYYGTFNWRFIHYLEFLGGSFEMELISFQLPIFSTVTMQNFEVETVDTVKGTTQESCNIGS